MSPSLDMNYWLVKVFPSPTSAQLITRHLCTIHGIIILYSYLYILHKCIYYHTNAPSRSETLETSMPILELKACIL